MTTITTKGWPLSLHLSGWPKKQITISSLQIKNR